MEPHSPPARLSAKPLLIFPHNGNGEEAADCLGSDYRLIAFIDDAPEKHGVDRNGNPVVGRGALARWPEAKVLAVPGSPASYRKRREVIEELGLPDSRFACVIHPSARISPSASIGHNVLIMAGVVITSNALIGDHVCVLPNTVIHHDSRIGAWTLIGSNVTLAGGITVGSNCYIGAGSSVREGLHIGDGALLGIGSNLLRDMPPGSRWIGNPARLLTPRVTPSLPPRAGRRG